MSEDIGKGDWVQCIRAEGSDLMAGGVYFVEDVATTAYDWKRDRMLSGGFLILMGQGADIAYDPDRFTKLNRGDSAKVVPPVRVSEPA